MSRIEREIHKIFSRRKVLLVYSKKEEPNEFNEWMRWDAQLGLYIGRRKVGYINYGQVKGSIGKILDVFINEEYRGHHLLGELLFYVATDLHLYGIETILLSVAKSKLKIWKRYGAIPSINKDPPTNMKIDIEKIQFNGALEIKSSKGVWYDESLD